MTSGRAANSGPSRLPSDTARPPFSTTATVCAAASSRDIRRATSRSGGPSGLTVPRSGQVPTTTSQPASRSVRTAAPSSRAGRRVPRRWVTSLPPMSTKTTCGRMTSARSTCGPRSLDCAPTTAMVATTTPRPLASATPEARMAAMVSSGWSAPRLAAPESPSTASRIEVPVRRPYRPSA